MHADFNKTYRQLLVDEFESRNIKNNSYSMRAFARDVGVSVSYLSMVFKKKRHLSQKGAIKIATNLEWELPKQEFFISLLEAENPKSAVIKEFAQERLNKLKLSTVEYSKLEIDSFTSISTWYYGAICTLLTVPSFNGTVSAISRHLQVPKKEIQLAMDRLHRLRLVKKEKGRWFPSQGHLQVKSVPSVAIRHYHKQMLVLAGKALDEQSFEERDFSNVTVAVDPKQIDAAKKKILEFRKEMTQLLQGSEAKELYQVSIQLFKLSKDSI